MGQVQPADPCHLAWRALHRSRHLAAGDHWQQILPLPFGPVGSLMGQITWPCRLDQASAQGHSAARSRCAGQARFMTRWGCMEMAWQTIPTSQDLAHGLTLHHSCSLWGQEVGCHWFRAAVRQLSGTQRLKPTFTLFPHTFIFQHRKRRSSFWPYDAIFLYRQLNAIIFHNYSKTLSQTKVPVIQIALFSIAWMEGIGGWRGGIQASLTRDILNWTLAFEGTKRLFSLEWIQSTLESIEIFSLASVNFVHP